MNHLKHIFAALSLAGALTVSAQVQNYALQFDADPTAVANLGSVDALADPSSFTLQFWFNPSEWHEGASLIRCGSFAIKLGDNHSLTIGDGEHLFSISSNAIRSGKWTHLTLRSGASTTATIDNAETFTADAPVSLPAKDKSIWLGGDFAGRIDEVRLWEGSLPEDYNSFWQNTVNELTPSYPSLLAYWKMDQEHCPNVVDYRGTAHGTLAPQGVSKTAVTDNEAFTYRVNLAYGNIQRFFDRKIDARHYSLSNRIAIIAAKLDTSTGAVNLYNPRYDAQMGDASHIDAYEGREGVADVSAGGITLPGEVLADATAYTFEAWVYPDALTADAVIIQKGNTLKLTADEQGRLSLTLNGLTRSALSIPSGEWTHVAISASGATDVTLTAGTESASLSFASTAIKSSEAIAIGSGLHGKVDDLIFWGVARSAADIASDALRMPLPDADHSIAGAMVWNMIAAYDFASAAEPGFDRFSVENWFRTMRSYTAGMRGVRFFLTVSAGSFDSCLANATKRNRAIADISALAEIDEFDGIDLDFEWPNNGWGNIATVAEGIHANLPQGKMLTISPHQVYYNYPVGRMGAVDSFNFQNYGPNKKNLFTRSGFEQGVNQFINHGYPLEKINVSFATTTSGGMNEGGNRVASSNPAYAPAGYRSIYKEGVTLPSDDRTLSAAGDCYYFFTGFDQTVFRAQYVVDHNLGGIFYWDLGNDLPASNTASLARAASYVINSNVEPLITRVDSAAPSPADDPNGPTAAGLPGGIEEITTTVMATPAAQIFDLQGRRIATPSRGLYIINGVKTIVK